MTSLTLIVALILQSQPIATDETSAADRAGELFDAGRYSESATQFRVAYEATGDPVYLFARAQALRRAGNCQTAMELLEQYLQTDPPSADVAVAQDVLDACREVLRRRADNDTTAAAPPSTRSVRVQPRPAQTDSQDVPQKPWYRDVPGGVLLGTGLASGVAAGVLYGVARDGAQQSQRLESEFLVQQRRARTMGTVSGVVLGTAAALLVGGVIRYALVKKRGRTP